MKRFDIQCPNCDETFGVAIDTIRKLSYELPEVRDVSTRSEPLTAEPKSPKTTDELFERAMRDLADLGYRVTRDIQKPADLHVEWQVRHPRPSNVAPDEDLRTGVSADKVGPGPDEDQYRAILSDGAGTTTGVPIPDVVLQGQPEAALLEELRLDVGVSFPGELVLVELLRFGREIWVDLDADQKKKIAGWFIEDTEAARIKAREFWNIPEK